MNYPWNWGIFWQPAADASGIWLQYLLAGIVWTLGTALAAWIIALAVGSIVGVVRSVPIVAPSASAITHASRAVASVQPRPETSHHR